jgi:hypothetical protein
MAAATGGVVVQWFELPEFVVAAHHEAVPGAALVFDFHLANRNAHRLKCPRLEALRR